MPTVLFCAFGNRPDALERAREAIDALRADVDVDARLHLLDTADPMGLDDESLVVSLGGDGTFLRAARLAHAADARVLGVNLGRVGFLLNVPAPAIVDSVRAALAGGADEHRLALEVTVRGEDLTGFALNEVVVERAQAGHMVKLQTFVSDEEYLTYSADGVMVATPTGSTGYNYSVGGPVLDATLPAMVLTPIAPHFTIDRSIVLGEQHFVTLTVVDKPAVLVLDGQLVGSLPAGVSVEVRKSPRPVRVVVATGFALATRLRQSLREGHA